jgi:hypothetical protein
LTPTCGCSTQTTQLGRPLADTDSVICRALSPATALVLVCAPSWLAACGDPLPDHGASRVSGTALPTSSQGLAWPRVSFEPPASAGGAARITRIRLAHEAPLGQTSATVFSGTITTTQLRDLSSGTMSETLGKRVVASVAWIDGDDPRLLSVAPLVPLAAGSVYTVAVADPPSRVQFSVDPGGAVPMLGCVWPPLDDAAASRRVAVWCLASGSDPGDFASADEPIALEPWGRTGRITGGVDGLALPGCLVWVADAPAVDGNFDLPPPSIGVSGADFAIDPTPLAGADTAPPVEPAACSPVEVPFGPGCAEVLDDRVIVRPPFDRVLWAIDAGRGPLVRASSGGARFVVRLAGDADPAPVRLTTIDRQASIATVDLSVRRAPGRNHVVVSEVYANPVGAEPAQEWVELFNDGSSAASIGGCTLSDGGGSAILPDAILAPGAYALVVNPSFVADDGVDPPPAQGTLIVRVGSLGQSGLSNEGEALVVRDPDGLVVSWFAAVKPKSGVSVVRLSPDALDEDPTSFALCPAGTSTPGAPNAAR